MTFLALAPQLARIPQSWQTVAFGRLFELTDRRAGVVEVRRLSLSSGGYLYRREGVADRQQASDQTAQRSLLVDPGQLVVNPMWLTGGSIAVSDVAGSVSPDYRVFTTSQGILPRFAHHLLRSQPYIDQYQLFVRANTTFDRRIQQEDLDTMPIPLPTMEEQRRIADFLDDRVDRIDRIIAARARQLEATTALGRLEVERILRPSDVKRLVRVRDVVSKVGSGKTPRGGADVYQDDGVIFLRSQNVRDEGLDLGDVAFISDETDEEMAGTRVHAGDVLLNITGGSLGRCCVLPAGLPAANVSQHVCIVRPSAISPTLLAAVLRSKGVRDQIKMAQVGGNREGLNFEQVRALSFWAGDEAADEGAIRESETRTLERVRHLERSIKLLTEYKSSLITAAVTGEIDVTASGSRIPA